MPATATRFAIAIDPLPLLRRMLGLDAAPSTLPFVPTQWERAAPARCAAAEADACITRFLPVGVPAGRTVPLPVLEGPVVAHCRRGEVWITRDGDPRDIVLRTGESHPLDHRDGLRVHALRGDGIVELETRRAG